MVREIYIRTKDDPNFVEGVIDYSNEVESVIGQLRVLLSTDKGDVLGKHDFGVDLDYLVFNTTKNGYEIKDTLDYQISQYVHTGSNINISTEVNFGKADNGMEYAVIDIYINGHKSIGFLVDKDNA